MERLSIVLPAYNERGNIAPLLEEIAAIVAANLPCPTEVIIVDDGSVDGTFVEAEQAATSFSPPLDAIVLVRLNRKLRANCRHCCGYLACDGRCHRHHGR
jgi:glycosyltransferase involved in cell wall biosynthesis